MPSATQTPPDKEEFALCKMRKIDSKFNWLMLFPEAKWYFANQWHLLTITQRH